MTAGPVISALTDFPLEFSVDGDPIGDQNAQPTRAAGRRRRCPDYGAAEKFRITEFNKIKYV